MGSLPDGDGRDHRRSTGSNFASTITIDKGRDDGVAPSACRWWAAGGLVGQVVEAYHHSAVVQLITDGQSRVGVVYGNDQFATVGRPGGRTGPLTAEFVAPVTHRHHALARRW